MTSKTNEDNKALLKSEHYQPAELLDKVIKFAQLKNDAALARALEVAAPVISKARNKHLPIGPSMLIRMHELTDLSIAELKLAGGIPRFKN